MALQIMAYGGDTQGLFRAGIMASGTSFGFGQQNLAFMQTVYDNITNTTGCTYADDSLQCLKELPFAVINETAYGQNEGQNFGPIIDGDFFRSYPIVAFNTGRIPPVNIITGCNSDEGMSLGGQTAPNTSVELAEYLETTLKINSTLAQQLLDLYPLDAPSPPYSVPLDYPWVEATAAVGLYSGNQTRRSYGIFTDFEVMAGRRKTATDWAGFGGHAYSYRFDTDPSRYVDLTSHYRRFTPAQPNSHLTASQSSILQAWDQASRSTELNYHGSSGCLTSHPQATRRFRT